MKLAPLAAYQFNVGDTVQVTVDFQYTVGVDTAVYLYAVLFDNDLVSWSGTTLCSGFPQAPTPVLLTKAETPTDKTATVAFTLPADGSLQNGTYGLAVWLDTIGSPGNLSWSADPSKATDSELAAPYVENAAITVSGNQSSTSLTDTITQMLPLFLMLMMVGMIAPMMQGMGGGQ